MELYKDPRKFVYQKRSLYAVESVFNCDIHTLINTFKTGRVQHGSYPLSRNHNVNVFLLKTGSKSDVNCMTKISSFLKMLENCENQKI